MLNLFLKFINCILGSQNPNAIHSSDQLSQASTLFFPIMKRTDLNYNKQQRLRNIKKIAPMMILSVFLFAALCFADSNVSSLKGEWLLAGVSSTATAESEPWQYTPISWEFINKKEMVFRRGHIESNFTYEIEGNDIKMTIMDITTTYTIVNSDEKSMVWHNPAMNNYYHLIKTK